MCDKDGKTIYIPLYAPDRTLTLDESNMTCPYETYNVEVRLNNYIQQTIMGVQIFAGIYSYLPLNMIQKQDDDPNNTYRIDEIPNHQLFTNPMGSRIAQTNSTSVFASATQTILPLNKVIIPTNITVHLGRPDRSAENVTVPFIYYLKNVASSEVYPTWPYEALKANIWAQISLVLNRVFTEWYPSKGYDFNITNSTAFDQAFVKNRNIYENMAVIVDEVFNEYIQKKNFMEPFYAEYCDGKIAQCPGMKQWGTLDLANRGFTALNILKYYYGDAIRILTSNNIQNIKSSYPGTPFRLGSSGPQVEQLQEQLNAIAINYPNIKPIFPINGIFGASTEAAVRVFQRQFNLTVDGIVGKATYFRISSIYAAVRKLAELGSLGIIKGLYDGVWPETTLRQGDRGIEVQLLQYYLSSISMFYSQIPNVNIDGRFGPSLQRSVLAFQKTFGLVQDGLVGKATWDEVYSVYSSLDLDTLPNIPVYPGRPLQVGSRGEDVVAVQNALNKVRRKISSIPQVSTDGIFGETTRRAIRAFQTALQLVADGIIGQVTWNLLFENAANNDQETMTQPSTAFDTVMSVGSFGKDVKMMQERLNTTATYYPSIPRIATDASFGEFTKNAVVSFQNLLGIPANGSVDDTTEYLLTQVVKELTQ